MDELRGIDSIARLLKNENRVLIMVVR